MKTVKVDLCERSYPIFVGYDISSQALNFLKKKEIGEAAFIITNKKVFSLHANSLIPWLKKVVDKVYFSLVPDSEKSKSFQVVRRQLESLASFEKGRRVFMVAFGGGVVGDLCGFVASVYKRGIAYIQIPTTLLSQVDAAIGGKTAIDLKVGKNLVGTFYQPRLVVADLAYLVTLDNQQWLNGLSEIVKYALIQDEHLFLFLERNYKRLLGRDQDVLSFVVYRCIRIKSEIVSQDEREEKGLRTILNLGHTIGHAIEAAGGYSIYSHGEAVALGMRLACDISVSLGLLEAGTQERINRLLDLLGLPRKIKGILFRKIIDAHHWDKKFIGDKRRMVLLSGIGRPKIIPDVPLPIIKKSLKKLY